MCCKKQLVSLFVRACFASFKTICWTISPVQEQRRITLGLRALPSAKLGKDSHSNPKMMAGNRIWQSATLGGSWSSFFLTPNRCVERVVARTYGSGCYCCTKSAYFHWAEITSFGHGRVVYAACTPQCVRLNRKQPDC